MWSEHIDTNFAQKSVINPGCWSTPLFVLKSGLSLHTHLGGILPQSLHFPPAKTISPHPSQNSFEQRTEVTLDRWLANITGPEVRGLYCPPFKIWWKKALHEITVFSQTYLNPFLRSIPAAHHYITWHPSTLATSISRHVSFYFLMFIVQWEIFTNQAAAKSWARACQH